MIQTLRNQDMKAEQRLSEFMDEYFYSRLHTKNGDSVNFTRMKDKESQLNGIDVCIETDKGKMYIDEKASVYYSNAMIPTFAFELDSIQKGHVNPIDGWFINDELSTEYYMLIWPNIKCFQQDGNWVRKDISQLTKDDFTIVEAMLIEKMTIRRTLAQEGYSRQHLIEYAKRFRDRYSSYRVRKEESIMYSVKIMYSGQLAEKPVNLVIRKELLMNLSKAVYLISADGYATIKG